MHPNKSIIFDREFSLMGQITRIIFCMRAACSHVGVEAPDPDYTRNVIGLGLH